MIFVIPITLKDVLIVVALVIVLFAVLIIHARWALYRAEKKSGVKYRHYAHGTVDDFIRNVRLGRKLENY